MLDSKSIATFIAKKRKEKSMTQTQLADKLNISSQAVSKWEKGVSVPTTELLVELAKQLSVSVDEILNGKEEGGVSYSKAGVDISYTDSIKTEMEQFVSQGDPRILNKLGAFASLYDFKFDKITHPVLVLKAEEPGSKQKLAIEYGYTESICHDMINHLVNDIIVMGAKPIAVLDTIVCGSAEKDTIKSLVKGVSDACLNNDCVLIGGETSIQPQVVDKGVYILTSSIAGVIEKDKIIDGSKISKEDVILVVASNGLHTNGYSLVRMIMDIYPKIKNEEIDGINFIDAIMKPHMPYYPIIKNLLDHDWITGMAHITGGGIMGNLKRIIPRGLCAHIDLSKIRVLPIFKFLRNRGRIQDDEMLSTFNCGVGLVLVVKKVHVNKIQNHIMNYTECYEVGTIVENYEEEKVKFENMLKW